MADDPAEDFKLLKRTKTRLSALQGKRQPWHDPWDTADRFASPVRSPFLQGGNRADPATTGQTDGNKVRLTNPNLMDGKAIRAARVCANGMFSGMSSPANPWFKITTEDPDLKDHQEVKEYLDIVEARIYGFLSKTDFYTSHKTGYGELVRFGTNVALMVEDAEYGGFTMPKQVGSYWLGLDHAGVTNALYSSCPMTASQIYETWGDGPAQKARWSNRLKKAIADEKWDDLFPCFHAIEPNYQREMDRQDRFNMPFRSYYWEATSEYNGFLNVGGYRERPFWAPRWETVGDSAYGFGPTIETLADIRQLQLDRLRFSQGRDFGITPALAGPPSLINAHANLVPRGLTAAAMVDRTNFGPIWEVQPQMLNIMWQGVTDSREVVAEGHYNNLFLAITNMAGIQPKTVEEVAKRNEEQLTQLGPAVERNQNEQLRVAIQRAYRILDRQGQLPPLPQVMNGRALAIEFISALAMMQRVVGVGSIERTLAFAGSMAASFPQVLDKFDADAIIDEYGDRVEMPSRLIRPTDEANKLREARANNEKMAQMTATLPAVKDGAQAAKLMSETQVGGGQSALQRILGMPAA